MSNQDFKDWMEFGKTAVEPMMRLNEITVQAMERVARQPLDVAHDYLELGSRQVSILGNSKSPEQLLSDQSELVSEFGEKLISRAQEFVKIATDTQQAVTNWTRKATAEASKAASGEKTG